MMGNCHVRFLGEGRAVRLKPYPTDAIEAIFLSLKQKSKYVLDADISQCFDKINHKKLLEKLNTSPTLRRQIRAWLKAGVWDDKQIFPTIEGSPQGGVISPLKSEYSLTSVLRHENNKTYQSQKRFVTIRREFSLLEFTHGQESSDVQQKGKVTKIPKREM